MTTAVATGATLSGKLPTPPKGRDSGTGSKLGSQGLGQGSVWLLCDQLWVQLQEGSTAADTGVSVQDQRHGFLCFTEVWRIRAQPVTHLTGVGSPQAHAGVWFRPETRKSEPKISNFIPILMYYSRSFRAGRMSLPATPF